MELHIVSDYTTFYRVFL